MTANQALNATGRHWAGLLVIVISSSSHLPVCLTFAGVLGLAMILAAVYFYFHQRPTHPPDRQTALLTKTHSKISSYTTSRGLTSGFHYLFAGLRRTERNHARL